MMEEKINILLISRDNNCVTEITNFLLKSECITNMHLKESYDDAGTITEYAYRGGPPTVFEGSGCGNMRVYFILKSFNEIKSDVNNLTQSLYHYDAVIMSLSDENDIDIVLYCITTPNYFNCPWQKHSMTIISNKMYYLQIFNSVDKCGYNSSSMWKWNGMFACNWSTRTSITNNLWIHINNNNYTTRSTRVSYNSEIMVKSTIDLFVFFHELMYITSMNVNYIARGMGTTGKHINILTLTHEGDSYRRPYMQAKELLVQINVSYLSDFDRLLKEEMKQLAYQLPWLTILCGEIVNFTYALPVHHCSGLEEFKEIYDSELQRINRENVTEVVLNSLDAMSEMKYTGKYIKDIFGIEKFNALKGFLKRPYSFEIIDSSNVPTTKADNPLGNEENQAIQHENRIQNIDIENRIGRIRLLKSLQKTVQEFTEEFKDMRQLQEQYSIRFTKDIREIKEKLSNLEQDNTEFKKKLGDLEQKHEEASMKSPFPTITIGVVLFLSTVIVLFECFILNSCFGIWS